MTMRWSDILGKLSYFMSTRYSFSTCFVMPIIIFRLQPLSILLHYLRLSKAKQITPARPCSPLDFSRCETLGNFFECTLYWLAPEYHILFSVKIAYHGGRPVCRGHLDLLEAWQLRRGDGRLGRGEPRDVIQVGRLSLSLQWTPKTLRKNVHCTIKSI